VFYLRMGWLVGGFLAAGAYGIGIALVRRDRSRVAVDYARKLARLTQPALGIRLEVEGFENLARHRPCVIIANHQTTLEVPILAALYPQNTVVVAKREIRKIPIFGWIYELTGNLLIDRSDRARSIEQLQEVARRIRDRGVSVWIFPEGTRGKVPGRLLPFKKGAFQLALAAGVPIVPVVVQPLRPVMNVHERRIRPGPVRVRVLDAVPTRGLGEEDLDGMIATTHARMSEALAELHARMEG
jgi:1-acyl-sn-glycerol-3-phosphate acyltransferase